MTWRRSTRVPPDDPATPREPRTDLVADLTRRADDIVNELDDVVKQMAELLRRRA